MRVLSYPQTEILHFGKGMWQHNEVTRVFALNPGLSNLMKGSRTLPFRLPELYDGPERTGCMAFEQKSIVMVVKTQQIKFTSWSRNVPRG